MHYNYRSRRPKSSSREIVVKIEYVSGGVSSHVCREGLFFDLLAAQYLVVLLARAMIQKSFRAAGTKALALFLAPEDRRPTQP